MTRHHEYSPSNWPKYAHCACFENEPVPDMEIEPEHPANVGTRIHAGIASKLFGRKYDCPVPLVLDEPEIVYKACAFWESLCRENGIGLDSPVCEEEISVFKDFEEIVYGTPDVVVPPDDRGVAIVVDWKSNRERGDYYAQMCVYALGAMQKYGCDHVEAYLCYCRIGDFDPDEDVFHINRAEAEHYVYEIYCDLTSECKTPEPHVDACKYCARAHSCEALSGLAVTVAENYSDDYPMVERIKRGFESYHPSKITDPDQMALAKDLRDIMKKWCDSVDHHAKRMAMDGNPPTGYKLTKPGQIQSCNDVLKAYYNLGLESESFLKCCSLDLKKAVDALAEYRGISKAEAKKHMQGALGALITVKEREPSLRKSNKKG